MLQPQTSMYFLTDRTTNQFYSVLKQLLNICFPVKGSKKYIKNAVRSEWKDKQTKMGMEMISKEEK